MCDMELVRGDVEQEVVRVHVLLSMVDAWKDTQRGGGHLDVE